MKSKDTRKVRDTKKIKVNILIKPTYKVPASLTSFTSGRGMIWPRSKTGVSAKLQRSITTEIKRARYMALIPYTYRHEI